jgi:putative acetyltransferase
LPDAKRSSRAGSDDVVIRRERAEDHGAVDVVLRAAFPTPAEAALVEALRAAGDAAVSLVAERRTGDRDGVVVGHVLFSPVTVTPHGGGRAAPGLGLAPLAVATAAQRRGIGGALVRAGLDTCRAYGCGFVVVLGDPGYYARFGFGRASDRGIANEYGADEEFMLLELLPDALPPTGGLARYAPAFAALPA